jgi:putative FmdB family regulatory protein
MPLYEYGCLVCGAQFEKLIRASSTDVVICPSCESDQVERLLSLFATNQRAPGTQQEGTTPSPGVAMHKPHCGYDWA